MSSSKISIWLETMSPYLVGKFSQAVETFGMQMSKSNHSVFYKNSNSSIILLVVYVDDIVITRSDSKGILSLKSFLYNQFHTKDLGMLKYFLGVEVMRSKQGILSSQRKYVLDLLYETGKLGAKLCCTPITPNVQITKEGDLFEDLERYKRLVGKLNYLIVTRPDIAYSVSVESVYVISYSQSLGSCGAYHMLLERSSCMWNIV